MKKLILSLTLAFFMFQSFAQEQQPSRPYVEVSGSAFTMLQPNRIDISITLSEAPSKGKITLSAQQESLSKALKEAGIDIEKQLVVVSQSSAIEKKTIAYQFKNYQLTLTSADELSTVFNAFDQNGITTAEVTRMWNNTQAEVEQGLKIQAVKNAKATASALSDAIGQKIGKAIYIQDYSYSTPQFDNVMVRGLAKANTAAVEPESFSQLQVKSIRLKQSVMVRFILE
ncbi:MAG: SIMPL domain-containing protein [Mucinivorans sp.]